MSGVIDHANLTLKFEGMLLSALDLGTAVDQVILDWSTNLSNGTGANQASQQWRDTRTLSASATENLDFAGGVTNAFGVALTFTKFKIVLIKASAANVTNSVQVQRHATAGVPMLMAASDGIPLTRGAWMALCWPDAAGIAVTATTGDSLTITNSAGTTGVSYDIVIVGVD